MARLQKRLAKIQPLIGATSFALIALLISASGCQTVGGVGGLGAANEKSKSVAMIAQESMQAAEFGQFETLGSDGVVDATPRVNRPISTRIRKPRATRSAASNQGPNGNALIDEIFDQTDIREALQAIASQANVSIIVDDQVAGTVTTLIQNEPLEQALQKILLPLGHHYRIVNGQYLICGSDPSSPMFSMISDRLDYSPVFAAPEELVELLSEKNKQFVRVAPKRNMVIVEAPTEIARQITDELQLFDRPVPQVVLEAMVVVVSPDTGFKFGTNVGQGYTDGDDNFDFNLDGLELSGSLSGAAFKNLFSNFALTSYFVRALEQEGYLSIRASPHVMAKNGEKAEISIARESFFSTQPLALSAQTFFRQDIQKVEAGISLIITPTIRGNNVTMVIEKAEVSEDIRATVDDPAVNNPFPLINRRQVSTTVHVEDGETVVIGGLMQNQMVDRVSRVPVLGDLPLIGRLFTQIVREEEAAEVVVFISPRIVHKDNPHPMAANAAVVQTNSEYKFLRHYPRDNGLEIGGPAVQTTYEQFPGQPVYSDQAYEDSATYGDPAYQQQAAPVQQPVYQQPMYQQPAAQDHSLQQRATPPQQESFMPPQTYQPQTYQNHLNPHDPHEEAAVAQYVDLSSNESVRGIGQTELTPTLAAKPNVDPGFRKILQAYPPEATQTYAQPQYGSNMSHPQSRRGTSARILQTSVQQTSHR